MAGAGENRLGLQEAPSVNFSRGLYESHMHSWMGPVSRGKVRDNWVIPPRGDTALRVQVTTDRQSAYDKIVGTVPGKGQVLNLLSAYWFDKTRDIIPNHMVNVPHPNVLIAEQAEATLPVEVVVRRYMAQSSTTTSVYHNYQDRGRREIYGIEFPDGLKANQEFSMGPIVTPTTKAQDGSHDEELTDEQATEIVDGKFGDGTWSRVKTAALKVFDRGHEGYLEGGLLLVDTKYEFGFNKKGELMLIDEMHTPDSSRLWLADTYQSKFESGETPETFDKEILRRWLAEHGFKGNGPIPVIDTEIIDRMVEAYTAPYEMVTGEKLPSAPSDVWTIRQAAAQRVAELLNAA